MAGIRKLAAILASDVVGYSKLAGADEDRTLSSALRALRSDLVDPRGSRCITGASSSGPGDGSLIEGFAASSTAVRCAIEVQSAMVERNAQGFLQRSALNFASAFIWATSSRRPTAGSDGRRRQHRRAVGRGS